MVLSGELLAIRQIIPYVGSGTDTVSIIIAAVLMPLAVGYYAGGQFQRKNANGKYVTVRSKLLRNIFISAFFLIAALSYVSVAAFFALLSEMGISNRILATTIYSCALLVTPVFLLAQTIPLVSNFFSKEKLSLITGKMLFFSTLGSFMGAVFSTLVLMSFLGTHHTTTITIGCLTLLYILLSKKILSERVLIMVAVFSASILINSTQVMRELDIVEYNQYNVIKVTEENYGATRILSLNGNQSSLYTDPELLTAENSHIKGAFPYIDFVNKNILQHIQDDEKVYSILVIGAGGFTVGIDDNKNDYVFVDIDKSLKRVSEEFFLKFQLGENKTFEPVPARSYLYEAIKAGKTFDLVFLDAYLGAMTVPEHLVTEEFYHSVRQVLKPDGVMAANFITSASFATAFSIKIDNTLRKVFPQLNRQVIGNYDVWNREDPFNTNIVYVFNNRSKDPDDYYTDQLNSIHYDKHRFIE